MSQPETATEKGMISTPISAFNVEETTSTIKNIYVNNLLLGSIFISEDGKYVDVCIHVEGIEKQFKRGTVETVERIQVSLFAPKKFKVEKITKKGWDFKVHQTNSIYEESE